MNDTNFTLSLDEQSLASLRATLIINITIPVVLGFITTLSNVGTIFVFVKGGKIYKTNHYKLVMHSASVAAIEAFYPFWISGVVRIVDTVISKPETITVLNCAMLVLPGEICWTLKQCNVLELACDRLLAIIFPLKYRSYNFSSKYFIIMITLSWIVAAIDEAVKYGLYTKQFAENILTICAIGNTNPEIYMTFRNARNIFVGSLTLIMYFTAMLMVKIKTSGAQTESTSALKNKFGYRLMLTSGVDAVIYVCTMFVSQIYLSIVIPSSTPQARMILSPIAFVFILLSTTPRFLVYYCMNKEFKIIVKKIINGCICRNRNTIEPCRISRTTPLELYSIKDEHKEKYCTTFHS